MKTTTAIVSNFRCAAVDGSSRYHGSTATAQVASAAKITETANVTTARKGGMTAPSAWAVARYASTEGLNRANASGGHHGRARRSVKDLAAFTIWIDVHGHAAQVG